MNLPRVVSQADWHVARDELLVREKEATRVHDALAALDADRPLAIPGFAMKLGMFLVRITPMSILRWASRFSAKRN